MDHIGFLKQDDTIAVRVSMFLMNYLDVLIIQMKTDAVVKGNYRKGDFVSM